MAVEWKCAGRRGTGTVGVVQATIVGLGLASLCGGMVAAQPAAPEILRGSVAPPPPVVEPAGGPAERRLVGGDRLWLVDEGARTLTGCRLVNTINVGVQAIECTTRRLPATTGRRN